MTKKLRHRLYWGIGLLVIVLAAVGSFYYQHQRSANTITIGAIGPDVKVWEHIADSSQAEKAGLQIKVKSFTDGVSLNKATAQGQVDVNAFQSWSYLQDYNVKNKKSPLVALGTTYLEPMGLYSDRYQKVSQLPDGATIAIANNPANTARGLLLLEKAGLITLKKSFTSTSGTNAIASNPKHLKFKEIDDTTGPRVIKSVDAVLIGNTIALQGHLNVLKDSIYHEAVNQSTKNNINVLATAKKNAHRSSYLKLVKLYHNRQIQKWIQEKYDGTKVEVNKPISYLKD
ncbi:metal ABC transporter substrate-binding protein [Limosilactobacillus gastricus]|uniref:Amino acid ABC transporter substrate binding component n=1 Tax=Limosilactobacillus gastricus DSM 16045 TaxID=1423749 RepID=A0A0R1V9S5_9LACO|nr:MetQ/NlpA family ABC transporter substrate-binding protein [Limosilactobacillus gastricus]KRM01941.1 Amino acid ABC transporter substrate binding component [Limosilactobacillus gastricus DSM 16045]QGF40326.1 metal ABC transporter substrate-binding protein [Limosilactobacillus gastricus]